MFLAALCVAAPAVAADYSCYVPTALGEFEGSLSVIVDETGQFASHLRMQAWLRGAPSFRRDLQWVISAPGVEVTETDRTFFLGPRPEAEAFRNGPNYVSIHWDWRQAKAGPIWGHYFANGRHVGTEMVAGVRETERLYRKRKVGLYGGLADRAIMARLADAGSWTVVAIDGTGEELFRDEFPIPTSAAAEAEYRRAREALNEVIRDFRNRCEEEPPPEAVI